ncbi:MAG: GntR family transcriptional regulator [Pseudomonadota bacterium]
MSSPNQPLYLKIRENLISRIASGIYATGECLPSEIALAEAEGVSPGTVRKAIDSLVADGALRRHQGKGTFVAEQTEERSHFQFFRLSDPQGKRVFPTPGKVGITGELASRHVAGCLDIPGGARVWKIDRIRLIDTSPAILETIVVSRDLMPELGPAEDLPNALYPFYQSRFGLTVLSTDDRLSAIMASPSDSKALGRSRSTPLLVIERIARDLMGRPIEWRRTRCLCQGNAWAVSQR